MVAKLKAIWEILKIAHALYLAFKKYEAEKEVKDALNQSNRTQAAGDVADILID